MARRAPPNGRGCHETVERCNDPAGPAARGAVPAARQAAARQGVPRARGAAGRWPDACPPGRGQRRAATHRRSAVHPTPPEVATMSSPRTRLAGTIAPPTRAALSALAALAALAALTT